MVLLDTTGETTMESLRRMSTLPRSMARALRRPLQYLLTKYLLIIHPRLPLRRANRFLGTQKARRRTPLQATRTLTQHRAHTLVIHPAQRP